MFDDIADIMLFIFLRSLSGTSFSNLVVPGLKAGNVVDKTFIALYLGTIALLNLLVLLSSSVTSSCC